MLFASISCGEGISEMNGEAASLGHPREIGDFLSKGLRDTLSALGLRREEIEAILRAAAGRNVALARAAGGGRVAAGLAIGAELARVLGRLAAEGRLTRLRVERYVRRLAAALELQPELVAVVLYIQALREPQLLELPPDEALEAQLRILIAFAPIEEASLWSAEPNGRLRCLLHVGDRPPTRRVRARAREALHNPARAGANSHAFIHAVPMRQWQHCFATLVIRARPEDRERALALAEELSPTLAAAIERQSLLERSAAGERSLVESSERRVARLGLDLHDGPIQELAALAGDLRLFRAQLSRMAAGHEDGDVLLGRVDDLDARLVELDHELRELTRSAETSALMTRSFRELLAEELQGLAGRRKIATQLAVRGRLDSLTASQRIALLRLVQEALTNVREHSGASRVSVTVSTGRTHVKAEVTDDGRGFDVERTLLQAARKGRLGLVGMNERIRLLGGRFDVQSRRGGPTTISATIPRWRPLEATAPAGAATIPARAISEAG
jgi:signal transduction histidine kinase